MGYDKARHRGLRRSALDFAFTAVAYNMKRSLSLLVMALPPADAGCLDVSQRVV